MAFFYSDNYYYDALSSINIALTCAVAMVPEGLEAIVTLVYSWAVKVNDGRHATVLGDIQSCLCYRFIC